MPNYDKQPEVRIEGYDDSAWAGWADIAAAVRPRLNGLPHTVLVIDCYPGVRLQELEDKLLPLLGADLTINVETARRSEQAIHDLLARHLTDDRVSPATSSTNFLIPPSSPHCASKCRVHPV